MTRSGEILDIPSLPLRADGSIDIGNHTIEAVLTPEGFNLPIATYSADATLRAGEDRVVVGTGDEDIYLPDLPVQGTGTSYTFVTLFVVDQGEAVVEYDEGDNRQAECHVIYR